MSEEMSATWEKRYMQRHYNYRDMYPSPLDTTQLGVTLVLSATQTLALFAIQSLTEAPGTVYYPFGYNARNWVTVLPALTAADIAGSKFAWPNVGEYASGTQTPRSQCYAREVMVSVTEDTWIRFISLNPVYLTLRAQLYTEEQIDAMKVPKFIVEVEHFVAQNDKDTFYLTYGVAIVFRADSAMGTIYVSIAGNVEGDE